MACVLAAWPAQGEPHPIQPMQGRSQIAPLTLVYGQQPPRIEPVPRVQGQVVRVWWPEDKDLRLQYNDQQPERRYVAPITLVYGQQPPLVGPLTPIEMAVGARSWDPPRAEPPPLVKVAPLTLVYGDAPPRLPPLSATATEMFRLAWEPPRPEPPPLVKVAPLTLVYGDQPMSDAKRIARHVAWRSWDVPIVSLQQPPGTAAWNVPAILSTVPFFRPPIVWAQADWVAQRSSQIVPLTLVYGNQPPIQGALTVAALTAIVAPRDNWAAQSESDNAHWNVPVIAFLPFSRPPQAVFTAWLPPDSSAQSRGPVAPLALVYGQNPPVNGAITPAELNEIVRAWDQVWAAQSQSPNAAWNVPLVVPPFLASTRFQHQIVGAWQLVLQPVQRLRQIAALGLSPDGAFTLAGIGTQILPNVIAFQVMPITIATQLLPGVVATQLAGGAIVLIDLSVTPRATQILPAAVLTENKA